ncbi:MAG: hypothetical protein SGI88_18095 [Candidatus Hydrogenedentes bacterium]|nr:hypothetical protein [Candidatus Hydrogenedentota bacterium]
MRDDHASEPVERYGKLEGLDRSFDIAYWQRLGSAAIFAAAHQMVLDAYRLKGIALDDRVRRDIEHYGKIPG